MYRVILLLFFVFLLLPFPLPAQTPEGWRPPTQKELANDLWWRKEDPQLYLVLKADFDGDGKEDVASLLINDKKNKIGLFVALTTRQVGSPLLLETMDDKKWIGLRRIRVAKVGE